MLQKLTGLLLLLCLALAPARAETPGTVSEAEATDLLHRWLQAQNDGNFDAYRALYAEKFLGIKRSGPRVYRFEAPAWLHDRERMFRKKMIVKAEKPQISTVSGAAIVAFQQTWTSGSYSDTGTKRLVLTQEHGQAKISREEMLESSLLQASTGPKPLAPEQFAFVLDPAREAGGPWLVLSSTVEEEWADPATLAWVGKGDPMVASAAFRGAPPQPFHDWIGRDIVLYGATGRLCEAKVSQIAILTRVEPHFGMRQEWTGQGQGEGEPVPTPPADVEVARQLWELGGEGRLVAGKIDGAAADCLGQALWARAKSLPEPVLYQPLPEALGQELQAQAVPLLQKLAGYAGIQKEYQELLRSDSLAPEDKVDSWDRTTNSARRFHAFQAPGSPKTLVYAASEVELGCAFERYQWAVWEAEAGRFSRLTDENGPTPFLEPLAVFDADGDGQPEVLGHEALLSLSGPNLIFRQLLQLPNFDCNC